MKEKGIDSKTLKATFFVGLFFITALAIDGNAKSIRRGQVEERLTQLESDVSELHKKGDKVDSEKLLRKIRQVKRTVTDMESRLARVEDYLDQGGAPSRPDPNPVPMAHVCSLKDTYKGRVYVEKASTQMMAEYNVKQACQSKVQPSYCRASAVCDTVDRYSKGYVCLMEDSYNSRSHMAEGESLVEAKANVIKACQAKVYTYYCIRKEPRCEQQ